jgi:hypothetical protein
VTPETFNAWLAAMKAAGRADTDADCAVALDVSRNTIVTLKRNGADRRTALACAALLAGLEAFEGNDTASDTGTGGQRTGHRRRHAGGDAQGG